MEEKFETWAIVELFGHARIAGRITDRLARRLPESPPSV